MCTFCDLKIKTGTAHSNTFPGLEKRDSPCNVRTFGPPLYLGNQWTENHENQIIPYFCNKKLFDEKKLTFKGQKGHAEVK